MQYTKTLPRMLAAALLLALGAAPAAAQTAPPKPSAKPSKYVEGVSVADKEIDKNKTVEGWDGGLRLGASFSFSSSRNVVGQIDGETLVLGASLNASLTYRRRSHDWRNRLSINQATSRTPGIDAFIKSNDKLTLESIYFYRIANSWIGPFARVHLATSLFEGHDVRTDSKGFTNYDVARVDGTVDRRQRDSGKRFALTDPFGPLTLKESIGVFLNPLQRTSIKIELWGAFSGRQTVLADNQFALNDDADTADVIEINELSDFAQAGPAAGLNISGSLVGNHLGYYLNAEAMIPVIKTDLQAGDDRGAIDLTNISIEAGLQIKVFDWAAIHWQLRAIREPQLLDTFQVQNMVLLTFNYTLIRSAQDPKLKEAPAKK
jgi:hypothetical protein